MGTNERILFELLNFVNPGEWESDVSFLEGRRYRGDAINRQKKLIIEIEGGTYPFYMKLKNGKTILATKGGHSSPEGLQRDMDKNNAIVMNGWKLLRYTPQTLKKHPEQIINDVNILMKVK